MDFLSKISTNKTITITRTNFAIGIFKLNRRDTSQAVIMMYSSNNMKIKDGLIFDSVLQDSIFLPESLWGNNSESVLAFVVYKNGKLFKTVGLTLASKIISAEVKDKVVRRHPRSIVIRLNVSQLGPGNMPLCSFWNLSKSGMSILIITKS